MANKASCSANDNNNIIFKSLIKDENGQFIKENDAILCDVIYNGEEQQMFVEAESLKQCGFLETNQTVKADLLEWGDSDTKLLLDKYEQYIQQVGPFKRYKNKKTMWQKISNDILCVVRSSSQCENRLKTVLKRKTKIHQENRQSGSTRTNPEYEEEINKIKSIDDSLEPEILVGVGEVKKNKILQKSPKQMKNTKKCEESESVKMLYKIHREKEDAKERRHKEKMKLIEMILKKD